MNLITMLLFSISLAFAPGKAAGTNCQIAGQRPACCAVECCAETNKPAAPKAGECCPLPCCPEWLCDLLGCRK